MKRWNLIIDVEKCEDCNNCFLACKDEHVGNDWPGYSLSQPLHGHRWMNIIRKERGQYPLIDVAYRPTPCMHCDNAPCIKASNNEAVYKRDDGIVMIDPEKAKGQESLVKSCPYEAIWWNEEKEVPQKCTLCAHLLDEGWEKPRCVQACPTGALELIRKDDSQIGPMIEAEELECLLPENKTSPRVFYKNLYRFEKCFIGGSVAFEKNGLIECAENASITLIKDSREIRDAITDNFGDFKFDGLDENSGDYNIRIKYEDREKNLLSIKLTKSLNLGTIMV
jgi:Fe-S-cluster-containing dehydrogenase component